MVVAGVCVCPCLRVAVRQAGRARPPAELCSKLKIKKNTELFSCKQHSDERITDKNNFPELIAKNTELVMQK